MKKILLFVLGAALCACTSKNPDDIVVNVEVENMTVSNVGLLIDRSTSFTIPLDKHGKGRLVITGLGNIYPRVIYGQTAKMAFICASTAASSRMASGSKAATSRPTSTCKP